MTATATDPGDGSDYFPRIPGYKIVAEIARSGLCTVYRARDLRIERDVALKVLAFGSGFASERLLQEARITASLGHPGIIPLHEANEVNGLAYTVMKLVQGSTLAALLDERPAPDHEQLVAVFERVCQTLAFAHSRGVIHCNLKPSKVMIGETGEVYVLGWGMTQKVSYDPLAAGPGVQPIVGTPAYMAPERARGGFAGARSDVFGLGGLLCFILTSKPVFSGATTVDLLVKSGTDNLSEAFANLDASGADAELIALAKRCLSPNPADRFADAGEVAAAVAAYRSRAGHPPQPDVPPVVERSNRKQSLISFLVVVAVLLLIGAIRLWMR